MKKHIKIKDSYVTWKPATIIKTIYNEAGQALDDEWMDNHLELLIIEWWLHNIGYWITKPFTFIPAIKRLSLRFKDVDLFVVVRTCKENG